MRSRLRSLARPGLPLLATAIAVVAASVAGCTHGRIQDYADRVGTRYIGEPVTLALNELGKPKREYPTADLRTYVWETGAEGALGGNCRLSMVSDRRGVIVDYAINGTPLGCHRLLNVS